MNERAEKSWDNANKSLENYRTYISLKPNRFELSYLDLLYISNFKGGNASIHHDEADANMRLVKYSEILRRIHKKYSKETLATLNPVSITDLIEDCNAFFDLTIRKDTEIFGFKAAYASALLHAYFPQLVPILDRRVLSSLGANIRFNSNRQVIDIARHASWLIQTFHQLSKENGRTIRELDRIYFTKGQ